MLRNYQHTIYEYLSRPVSIAPLVTFRILFGLLMCWGTLRTMYNGWVDRLYVEPGYFFKFYGFEWIEPLSQTGMYVVFWGIALSALLVALGWFYRLAIITFFILFTYVELIDVTNYLNHYYLVCLLAFLLIFLPANRAYSLDVWQNPKLAIRRIPRWCIQVIQFQLAVVYIFAGLAKLNPDWLFEAMPLAIWLPTKVDTPLIGWLFHYDWVPYAFSWGGAIYDLTIVFFLLNHRTRPFAYVAVVLFHGITWALFNIGLFPLIMTLSTLIFFSDAFHERLLNLVFGRQTAEVTEALHMAPWRQTLYRPLLILFICIQLTFPLRFMAYPGDVHWTEEGYRFSWRVMLVEKNGQITFRVHDPATGRFSEVNNADFLTTFQEKQLSIQPDLIVQFAQYLKEVYAEKYQIENLQVTAEAYVSLNGRPSQQFIDPKVDLASIQLSWAHRSWVIPFMDRDKADRFSQLDH